MNLSTTKRMEKSGSPHVMHNIGWQLNDNRLSNCFENRHKRTTDLRSSTERQPRRLRMAVTLNFAVCEYRSKTT